jgi:hypothetical protein
MANILNGNDMGSEKTYEEYRKIVIRFLKDAGLYKLFIGYLNFEAKKRGFYCGTKSTWYKQEYIDRILGRTDFTRYLEDVKNLKPKGKITTIFRTYLHKKYNNKFQLYRRYFISEHDALYNNIDVENNIINVF